MATAELGHLGCPQLSSVVNPFHAMLGEDRLVEEWANSGSTTHHEDAAGIGLERIMKVFDAQLAPWEPSADVDLHTPVAQLGHHPPQGHVEVSTKEPHLEVQDLGRNEIPERPVAGRHALVLLRGEVVEVHVHHRDVRHAADRLPEGALGHHESAVRVVLLSVLCELAVKASLEEHELYSAEDALARRYQQAVGILCATQVRVSRLYWFGRAVLQGPDRWSGML